MTCKIVVVEHLEPNHTALSAGRIARQMLQLEGGVVCNAVDDVPIGCGEGLCIVAHKTCVQLASGVESCSGAQCPSAETAV